MARPVRWIKREPMDSPIRIDEATIDDLEEVVALLADDVLGATRETSPPPLDPCYVRAFEAIAADPLHSLLVVREAGRVAACLQLRLMPSLSRRGMLRALIENVRVAKAARGRGLGELLMDAAIERARAAGCGLVQLTTDRQRVDAHRFYERLGFEATHLGMKLKL